MRNALSIGLALALAVPILASDDVKQPPTPQIQRGHDLFVKPAKGVACATCHRMGGEGIAIGPDLTTMGTQGTPHVIVMTYPRPLKRNRSAAPAAAEVAFCMDSVKRSNPWAATAASNSSLFRKCR